MGAAEPLHVPPFSDERCLRLLVAAKMAGMTAVVAPWAAGCSAGHALSQFANGLADMMDEDAAKPETATTAGGDALRIYARDLREQVRNLI